MGLQIKNTTVLGSLMIHPAHPLLIELLKWVSVRFSNLVITGGYEKRDYPSVHSVIPCRGVDIRSSIYEDPKAVVVDINTHWIYDYTRPEMKCAILHNVGRGMHIHLQVHGRTRNKRS